MNAFFGASRDFGQRREWLSGAIAAGRIGAGDQERARRALALVPSGAVWRTIAAGALAAAGLGLLAAALVFAVAFNWDALGHFSRFALVEFTLAIFALTAWWRGVERVSGEAALFAACVATGALLALFGQTYQTGADPWSLFFTWAVLILPWLLHACRASLWLLWVVLIEVSLALYCGQVPAPARWFGMFDLVEATAALSLIVNGALLVGFECLPALGTAGLARAVPRLLALLLLSAVASVLLPIVGWRHAHMEDTQLLPTAGLALLVFGALLWHALRVRRDVLVLAAGALTAIGIGQALLARLMSPGDPFGFFFLSAIYWVGTIALAVNWLRGAGPALTHREAA